MIIFISERIQFSYILNLFIQQTFDYCYSRTMDRWCLYFVIYFQLPFWWMSLYMLSSYSEKVDGSMQEQWLIFFYPRGSATQWLGWISFSTIFFFFFFCNQAYMDVQKHYLLITEITLESHIFSLRNMCLLELDR